MLKKKNPRTKKWEAGGTNGGHLGSFQLVKFLSHGRAVAILNLYYALLFARVTEKQNYVLAGILQQAGYLNRSLKIAQLKNRKLAEIVIKGMLRFYKKIGFPRSLKLAGIPREQIQIMLAEAKNPQLKMKLQNMPIPLQVDKGDIESLMAPTLQAAYLGEPKMVPDFNP